MKFYNIPIFVPHLGCPFDCVFCNQRKITGTDGSIDENNVKFIIEEHLKMLPKDNCKIEIAFFGGSFTGIDEKLQERLLSCAYLYVGKFNITGIRVSTRPDYIDDTVLKRLVKYGVTTVELGVQSMDEEVLFAACRGHSPNDVEKAVKIIRKYPVTLGLQMMTGLPKDNCEKALKTADALIALKPDIVRIYPTLVIKGTELENMYNNGSYTPQSVEEAVRLCHKLLKKFNSAGITVIRIGLQNTDEISPDGSVVAGPYHSAFGELVESEVYFDRIAEKIAGVKENNLVILVNPSEISKAVGHKRINVKKIFDKYGKKIKVSADANLKKGDIVIKGR